MQHQSGKNEKDEAKRLPFPLFLVFKLSSLDFSHRKPLNEIIKQLHEDEEGYFAYVKTYSNIARCEEDLKTQIDYERKGRETYWQHEDFSPYEKSRRPEERKHLTAIVYISTIDEYQKSSMHQLPSDQFLYAIELESRSVTYNLKYESLFRELQYSRPESLMQNVVAETIKLYDYSWLPAFGIRRQVIAELKKSDSPHTKDLYSLYKYLRSLDFKDETNNMLNACVLNVLAHFPQKVFPLSDVRTRLCDRLPVELSDVALAYLDPGELPDAEFERRASRFPLECFG